MIIAEDITAQLEALIGCPYQADGRTPKEGFDCWGLVSYAFALAGHALPGDQWHAAKCFRPCPAPTPFQPFDLLLFRLRPGRRPHVGLMLDSPRFIQCSQATNGVACSEWTRAFWRNQLSRIVRHRDFL